MSTGFDLPPIVEQLIRDLRAEVRALTLRSQALEARIALLEEFEVVTAPAVHSPRASPAASSASAAPLPAVPLSP